MVPGPRGPSLAQGRTATTLPQVINRSSTELPLTVSYDKISLGRLRFWIHMQDAVYSLQQFGEAARLFSTVVAPFPRPPAMQGGLWFLPARPACMQGGRRGL